MSILKYFYSNNSVWVMSIFHKDTYFLSFKAGNCVCYSTFKYIRNIQWQLNRASRVNRINGVEFAMVTVVDVQSEKVCKLLGKKWDKITPLRLVIPDPHVLFTLSTTLSFQKNPYSIISMHFCRNYKTPYTTIPCLPTSLVLVLSPGTFTKMNGNYHI